MAAVVRVDNISTHRSQNGNITDLTCHEDLPDLSRFSAPTVRFLPHLLTSLGYVAMQEAVQAHNSGQDEKTLPPYIMQNIAKQWFKKKRPYKRKEVTPSHSISTDGGGNNSSARPNVKRTKRFLDEVKQVSTKYGWKTWPLERDGFPLAYDWRQTDSVTGTAAWNQWLAHGTMTGLSNLPDEDNDNIIPTVTPVQYLLSLCHCITALEEEACGSTSPPPISLQQVVAQIQAREESADDENVDLLAVNQVRQRLYDFHQRGWNVLQRAKSDNTTKWAKYVSVPVEAPSSPVPPPKPVAAAMDSSSELPVATSANSWRNQPSWTESLSSYLKQHDELLQSYEKCQDQ